MFGGAFLRIASRSVCDCDSDEMHDAPFLPNARREPVPHCCSDFVSMGWEEVVPGRSWRAAGSGRGQQRAELGWASEGFQCAKLEWARRHDKYPLPTRTVPASDHWRRAPHRPQHGSKRPPKRLKTARNGSKRLEMTQNVA